jgi:outer membrane lipoprotein LolB
MFGRDQSVAGSAESFEMQGRIYARFGAHAFSGSIRWRHTRAADELWLGGPLGQTVIHIMRDVDGATLTTANGQVYRAFSLEGLMQDALGWAMPLADLSHYVLGEVPPGVEESAVKRDANGRLLAVSRNGWTVALTGPQQPEPAVRPTRLTMSKDSVEVRMVIDQLDADMG